jgi:hypothetical protein
MSERDQTRLSSVVTLALGVSLWAQLFWSALSIEWTAPSPSTAHLVAYAIPLVVAIAASAIDYPIGRLFVFPVSCLPALAMMPQPDMATLGEPLRLGLAGITLAGYLAVGAWASRQPEPDRGVDDRLEEAPRQVDGLYRGFWWIRGAFVLGLLGALLWSILVDPAIDRSIQEAYGGRVETARTFLLVFGFFLWTVLAYAFFYRPLANLEYDVRRLRERTSPDGLDRWPVQRRMITWVALGSVAFIVALSLGGVL